MFIGNFDSKKEAWTTMIDKLDLDIWGKAIRSSPRRYQHRNPGRDKQLEQANTKEKEVKEQQDKK